MKRPRKRRTPKIWKKGEIAYVLLDGKLIKVLLEGSYYDSGFKEQRIKFWSLIIPRDSVDESAHVREELLFTEDEALVMRLQG